MPVNNMSVGRDYTFGLFDSNTGDIVDLGDVQSVKISAQKHDLKSMPYNGDPRFGFIQDGFKGTFTIMRTGPQLEDLQISLNEQFNNGAMVKTGYLNETVREFDGSVSRYQYTGAAFFLTEVVDVSRDKAVAQTVEVVASNKIKLA